MNDRVAIAKKWIAECAQGRMEPSIHIHDHKGQYANGVAACGSCICFAMAEYASESDSEARLTRESVNNLANAVKTFLDDWDRGAGNSEIKADVERLKTFLIRP